MISAPGFEVTLQPSATENDTYHGPTAYRARALRVLEQMRHWLALPHAQPIACHITQWVPPHQGLGSGTQMALAVAHGMARLLGQPYTSAWELAPIVERGQRSGLGLHGFDRGGFLMEGGKRQPGDIASLLFRSDFPAEWTTLIIAPPAATGLNGVAETQAFRDLPPMPQALTAELARRALLELAPAIAERQFAEFATSLTEFGRLVGEYFAPVQGDVLAHPRMLKLAETLRQEGVQGLIQSSWGPSLATLWPTFAAAQDARHRLQQSEWQDCGLIVAPPLNTGAQCETEAD